MEEPNKCKIFSSGCFIFIYVVALLVYTNIQVGDFQNELDDFDRCPQCLAAAVEDSSQEFLFTMCKDEKDDNEELYGDIDSSYFSDGVTGENGLINYEITGYVVVAVCLLIICLSPCTWICGKLLKESEYEDESTTMWFLFFACVTAALSTFSAFGPLVEIDNFEEKRFTLENPAQFNLTTTESFKCYTPVLDSDVREVNGILTIVALVVLYVVAMVSCMLYCLWSKQVTKEGCQSCLGPCYYMIPGFCAFIVAFLVPAYLLFIAVLIGNAELYILGGLGFFYMLLSVSIYYCCGPDHGTDVDNLTFDL